jgi:hypothetical protein
MSAKRLSVKAKKPVPVWKKPVKLSFKDLFVALSNGHLPRCHFELERAGRRFFQRPAIGRCSKR